jgi:hypothetical protein
MEIYDIYSLGYSKNLVKEDDFYLDAQGTMPDKTENGIDPSQLNSGEWIGNQTMVDGFFQSNNYVAGVSGWKILPNGNVEFGNGNFRGTINATAGTFGQWTISGNSFATTNDNIIIGTNSGVSLTTGFYNTFLGQNSGAATTEGSSNLFVGLTSGYQNIIGIGNLALGAYSGYKALGNYNVFVGYDSGENNTGSGSVCLGAYSGRYETESNKFYVDNQLRGSEANDRSMALLYGVFNATASSQTLTTNSVFTATYGIATRVGGTTSSSTPTPDCDTQDLYDLTALATGATFGAPTGTPWNGKKLIIRIKDNGSQQTLAWNPIYVSGSAALPSLTVTGKIMHAGFIYNSNISKWMLVALTVQP